MADVAAVFPEGDRGAGSVEAPWIESGRPVWGFGSEGPGVDGRRFVVRDVLLEAGDFGLCGLQEKSPGALPTTVAGLQGVGAGIDAQCVVFGVLLEGNGASEFGDAAGDAAARSFK